MSVLDPFEVFEIEVWPLPHLQGSNRSDGEARQQLDALERSITARAIESPEFKAILNEKDPPAGKLAVEAPPSLRGRIVSERVFELRSHPDFRLARRALILAPCSGDLRTEGSRWPAASSSHPGQTASVASGASLRCARRSGVRCARG